MSDKCPECGSTGSRHEIGCHSGGMPVCLINDMFDSGETISAGTEGQVTGGVWCADFDRSCIVSFGGREVRCELSNIRRTYRTLAEGRARSLAMRIAKYAVDVTPNKEST
jgi:hypothetical protein